MCPFLAFVSDLTSRKTREREKDARNDRNSEEIAAHVWAIKPYR